MTSKAIIINGFARGGTNILWNVMQSHPNICSPICETNEIIEKKSRFPKPFVRLLKRPYSHKLPVVKHLVRKRLEHCKLLNANHPDNMYKSETLKYSIAEIKASTICLKGVYNPGIDDISYSQLLDSIYSPAFHITIIREGFSLCEGWTRRGIQPETTGKLYTSFMKIVARDKEKFVHYALVDFDLLLNHPFEKAEKLFMFCDEKPFALEKLRLKVKRTIDANSRHEARYGQENKKYWFDKNTISEIINPSISNVQASKITDKERNAFYTHAKEGMQLYEKFITATI